MKEDNSKNNYNYMGLSIDKIISNPEEYIVPECMDACKSFWNKNIFTASCSNRRENKDKDGNITKYIMVSHLSDENKKIFEDLIKLNPKNYKKTFILNEMYYAIAVLSKDSIQERDQDSQKLLDLARPFKIQDCLEGFVTIQDYYKKEIIHDKTISEPDFDVLERVKKHLHALGKIDLLDLDRNIIYNCKFYKDAHQKYLEYIQKNKEKEELFIE